MSTDVRSWDDVLTARERVRLVARSLIEPRTASWIAEEADVAHGTAKKYLSQLVDEHEVLESDVGGTVTYSPDRITQYLDEVRELLKRYSAEELASSLTEMKDQIREWQDEFDVESPNELRATLGETDLGRDEEARRCEIASEWEHLRYRIDVVADTLALYDRFDEHRRERSAA